MSRQNFTTITGYFTWHDAAVWKNRMSRLRTVDHRLSESRIVEEALKVYIPMVEAQLLPTHEGTPTRRRRRAVEA